MNLDPVGSWVHLTEEKAAVRIAHGIADCTRVHLGCLDLGIGNHRAALVGDAPGESAAGTALRQQSIGVNHS